MIIDYGFSIIGKSHIANNTCCQDNHKIKKLDNGWIIAAIADGVGSAKNSQIGSKIAVETVVDICEKYMPWDYSIYSIKSLIITAYNYAFKQIIRESENLHEPLESFDTTLTMVIYDGHRIVYGHSGDGAIIGLNTYGNYVQITRPQKGADKVSVVPLRQGYASWVVDIYEEDLVSVLLITDGMLDILYPYLLFDRTNKINNVYVPLISFFADPLRINSKPKENESFKKSIETFISGDNDYDSSLFYKELIPVYKNRVHKYEDYLETIKKDNFPVKLMQNVQDDKTVVGLINTDFIINNEDETYYMEPNWYELQEAWNRIAYPHLYN